MTDQIVKNYRDNVALRHSFNELAEKTFGLNFEGWYQNGFWGDHYNPYSVVEGGRVVANVSVNRTDMRIGGEIKHLVQLGTVMTAEDCRNRGMIRAIMAEIEKDTRDADGIYLFANDSVLDFYPKFGFRRGKEYLYTKQVNQSGPCDMVRVPMNTPADWSVLRAAMEKNEFKSGCRMVDNPGLIFFYVSQFMRDCVYCCGKLDAWVIAEQEGENLLIHDIFSPPDVTPEDVIAAFGSGVKRVELGFAPADTADFTRQELREDDCTFFVKGAFFEEFEARALRIPSLSHA